MDNTYSVKNLITLLLRKIWLIIAVTLCGGLAAFCVSKFVLPLEYSSHISMYVQSYTNI
ncbi:MAG: Wzz/FepE/Etk N-terminal domain-containing protein, partial [Ruminococcus flavefaciens]|nr:Wzz/FepE/Etk N-terminal domain-containing protein [Ruminococcus flavefaciens]